MGVLVSSSDFTGKWAIPSSVVATINDVISDKEVDYLTMLLGADLYWYFNSKLPVNVLPTVLASIYNAFAVDYNYGIVKSKGMKTMLKNFLWFEAMRDVKFKATNEGIVVNVPDSAKECATGNLYDYYNDGIDTFNAIQNYIKVLHPGDYSFADIGPSGNSVTYNGQLLERCIPLFGL